MQGRPEGDGAKGRTNYSAGATSASLGRRPAVAWRRCCFGSQRRHGLAREAVALIDNAAIVLGATVLQQVQSEESFRARFENGVAERPPGG